MAWRIHDNVVRGEIDNRQRGIVRGRIWLRGLAQPIKLELAGNACADLAGCRLTFENPCETVPLREDAVLNPLQRGTIGDLTASRKVRVFDIPVAEALERRKKNLPVPEHMANCLYLEWFSERNGRVVIESADYKLTISPPAWRLSPEEEAERSSEAADGFSGFLKKLTDDLAASKHSPPEDKEWDEFDYERFMRESDARTDKYGELFDKYMDHPDRDRIIAREMGWTWMEEALDEEQRREKAGGGDAERQPGATTDAESGEQEPFDPPAEPDPEPDPKTEGVDWVRAKDGHVFHPLSLRALEGSIALHHLCTEQGLEENDDEDLANLIGEYQTTSAKLAGALDSLGYGRNLSEGAFIVAYLKRALGHLHATQGALEKVASKKLLPAKKLTSLRADLFSMREEILRLMAEFRGKKK